MPFATRNLNAFNARGLRQMLAGMVLLSMAVGLVAIGASLALAVPTWIALAAYPVVCSVTLLITAALWNLRTSAVGSNQPLARSQA